MRGVLYYRVVSLNGQSRTLYPQNTIICSFGNKMLDCVQPAFEVSTLHFNRTIRVACILTPLTGGPLIIVRWVTLMPESGWVEG